jgi:hypothetical protein
MTTTDRRELTGSIAFAILLSAMILLMLSM